MSGGTARENAGGVLTTDHRRLWSTAAIDARNGRASIVDKMDNGADQHVAEVLARAVAGVTDVRVAAPERM